MRPVIERLENRTRAMDLPVETGWKRTLAITLALFAWSVAAFNLGG